MHRIQLLTWLVLGILPSLTRAHAAPPWDDRTCVDMTYTFDDTTIGSVVYDTPFKLTITYKGVTEYGFWLQSEELTSGTHQGTHIDAPCHVVPGGWTVDQIPLSRFVAPAAVVDISARAALDPDALLEISDLVRWEVETGYSLDHTIVLMRTGWGRRWHDKKAYLGTDDGKSEHLHFPGISPAAARWLVEKRQIRGVGVDVLSIDSGANLGRMPAAAHKILLGANLFALENLANLEKLPIVGAKIYVLPMKLGGGACGSPTRVVADTSGGRSYDKQRLFLAGRILL